jgi:hypothetical protein
MPIITNLRDQIGADAGMTASDWTPAKEQEASALKTALSGKLRESAQAGNSLAQGVCNREGIAYAVPTSPPD